jgi:hypothetical protein
MSGQRMQCTRTRLLHGSRQLCAAQRSAQPCLAHAYAAAAVFERRYYAFHSADVQTISISASCAHQI